MCGSVSMTVFKFIQENLVFAEAPEDYQAVFPGR